MTYTSQEPKRRKNNVFDELSLLLLLPTVSPYRFLPEREILPYAYLNYNSNPVVYINNVPHHVIIVYGSRYCSGSLIGSKVVITAASCLVKRKNEPVIVKVGSNTTTGNGQIIPVVECKIHEYYKHLSSLDNDIALLILQAHVVFGNDVIKTVLVEPEIAIRVGAQVVVTGWGGIDLPAKYLNLLLRSEMLIIDRKACQTYYGELITPSNYCAKYNLEHRLSDNGGGAIFEGLLVGILSSGTDSKQINSFAILTNVSYFHRQVDYVKYKQITQ
nr:vitellin-degrading protease-like [Vanessa tameamea]